MKILVGILHSIENEFEESLDSLNRQSYQEYDQFVVEGLPNRQAHDTLYRRFMDAASAYDLFMKLDADMVLEDRLLLERIVSRFQASEGMDVLTIPVLDFFTGRYIQGFHTYRSNVTWARQEDDVFTDMNDVSRKRTLVEDDPQIPSITHCKNPSDFQAFHYGLHRGVKVKEALTVRRKQPVQLVGNFEEIQIVWNRFLDLTDRRLGLASLGAEHALSGHIRAEHVSYTNPYARSVFETRYQNLSTESIAAEAGRMRRRNRVRMPWLYAAVIGRKALLPWRRSVLWLLDVYHGRR